VSDRRALLLLNATLNPEPRASSIASSAELVIAAVKIVRTALIEPESAVVAKIELLEYLLDVAQKTEGAAVWRALFAEMLKALEAGLEDAQR
jgi:hypothetical protein